MISAMLSDRIRARQSLSKLVAYINLIDSIESDDRVREIVYLIESVAEEHKMDDIEWDNYQPIDQDYTTAIKHAKRLPLHFRALRQEVFTEVLEHEHSYYSASTNFYQYNKDSVEGLDSLDTDPEFADLVRNRINIITDWQFPGVVFRPQACDFMREMVACDPLYLVDTDHDSMLPGIEQFGKRYQRRLCFSETIEYIDSMMEDLPAKQIGLIFVTNFFELRPIELLEKYFREFLTLLRSGGKLAFTFNDCDDSTAVKFVEARQRCYTPGREVLRVLEDLGYTIVYKTVHNSGLGYIECTAPGELTTLRGGQTLAKPIPI